MINLKNYVLYEIINLNNNKKYIGITKRFEQRKKEYIRYLKGNYHKNKYLQHDFNLNHEFTFKIIYKGFITEKEASQLEIDTISKYNKKDLYNLNIGGINLNKGYKKSNYAKKIASEVHSKKTGEKNSFYGKKHSDKSKKLIANNVSKALKNKPKSEIAKKNMFKSNAMRKEIFVNGEIYLSLTKAEIATGINRKKLSKIAKEKSNPNIYFLN